ncbi:MAG: glycosyltransferase [Alphaproteobacteria bacterium]|nr:glycosyltransferase [Alphaproteobacteria bacterium]
MASNADSLPRASVFMFVRNGAGSIRRAIDSVLAQTYRNVEFIVQDGASTDGTLDILASYGERLTVVSEPDRGPSDGLLRALNRCTGNMIGSCLADEELLPDAVDRAVRMLQREPDIGAITGDAIITDVEGKRTGFWHSAPFNFIDYLLCDYTPYFCSSFFRRRALIDAGLLQQSRDTDCVEFDLWCRLAACTRIEYAHGAFAKYASHPDQSSNKQRDVAVHFAGRLKRIVAMCSEGGFFGESPLLRALFVRGHTRTFLNHAIANGLPDVARDVCRLAEEALAPFPPALLDGGPIGQGSDPSSAPAQAAGGARPTSIIQRLIGKRRPLSTGPQGRSEAAVHWPPVPAPVGDKVKARMYAELARRYEATGRLREALDLWRAAGALSALDGLDRDVPPRKQPRYEAG